MIKVTIVDDSKEFRNALKELLKEIGGTEIISEAENGSELLRKIIKNKPDLIFMDIEMPYVNGFEATKSVISLYPEIKIVGMSSYEKEDYIKKLIDCGAKGYLIKSGDNFETIKELVSGKIQSFVYSPEINFYQPLLKSDKTILFVDKSEDKHLNLRYFLRKYGYKVLKSHNATESIYFLKNKKVNAIIIDSSVINGNNKFINSILNINENLIVFVLLDNNITIKYEEKYKPKIFEINKNLSPETIIEKIETAL